MQLKFSRTLKDRKRYLIIENAVTIFYALYDKKTSTKSLYTMDDRRIGFTYPFKEKWYQLTDFHWIQVEKPFAQVVLKPKSTFYGTKQFRFENSTYEVIPHFGTRLSIYRNDKQVASFNTVESSNAMMLTCDDNLSKPFFSLLCLCIYSNFPKEHMEDNPPHNFWFQARKNDKHWKPNH